MLLMLSPAFESLVSCVFGGKIASALNYMNSEWRDENLKGSSVVLLSRGATI